VGSLNVPLSGRVYVDTQILIYTVEKFPGYLNLLTSLWESVDAGRAMVMSSQLVAMETLIVPLRRHDDALVADFEQIMQPPMKLIPISAAVLRQAAVLRAEIQSTRTPDAIHAGTALLERPDLFLTNDRGFKAVKGLPVVILDDLISQS
jgi:predicted nucleic acid-binding protein